MYQLMVAEKQTQFGMKQLLWFIFVIALFSTHLSFFINAIGIDVSIYSLAILILSTQAAISIILVPKAISGLSLSVATSIFSIALIMSIQGWAHYKFLAEHPWIVSIGYFYLTFLAAFGVSYLVFIEHRSKLTFFNMLVPIFSVSLFIFRFL